MPGGVAATKTATEGEDQPVTQSGSWSLNRQTLVLAGLDFDGDFTVSATGDMIVLLEFANEDVSVGQIEAPVPLDTVLILVGMRTQSN